MAKVTLDIPVRFVRELDGHVEVFEYDNRSSLIRQVLRAWLDENRDELLGEAERLGIDLDDEDD